MENLEFDEKPKFVLKDYSKAMHIKLWFLLACVIFIYGYFYRNPHSVFYARMIYDGIFAIIGIIFFILFQRKSTIDFYNDKIEFSEILSIKKETIILNEILVDEIVIRPYNQYTIDINANPVGAKETVGPFTITKGNNDAKMDILFSSCIYIFLFPFILILKIFKMIKSIKFDMLSLRKLSIPLSELSSYEFSQLNSYLKEKFGLEIKDIRKINFKGETIC